MKNVWDYILSEDLDGLRDEFGTTHNSDRDCTDRQCGYEDCRNCRLNYSAGKNNKEDKQD